MSETSDRERQLYEALADITSDALAVREGVQAGNNAGWASVDKARRLLDQVFTEFEPIRHWPRDYRYGEDYRKAHTSGSCWKEDHGSCRMPSCICSCHQK